MGFVVIHDLDDYRDHLEANRDAFNEHNVYD